MGKNDFTMIKKTVYIYIYIVLYKTIFSCKLMDLYRKKNLCTINVVFIDKRIHIHIYIYKLPNCTKDI